MPKKKYFHAYKILGAIIRREQGLRGHKASEGEETATIQVVKNTDKQTKKKRFSTLRLVFKVGSKGNNAAVSHETPYREKKKSLVSSLDKPAKKNENKFNSILIYYCLI